MGFKVKKLQDLRDGDFFRFVDPLSTQKDVCWIKLGRNTVYRGVIMCNCLRLGSTCKRRYPGFLHVEILPYNVVRLLEVFR